MFQSEQWLKSLLSGVNAPPVLLRGVLPDKTATEIARAFNLAGYQGTVTTACSSSATAIGWGAELVAPPVGNGQSWPVVPIPFHI